MRVGGLMRSVLRMLRYHIIKSAAIAALAATGAIWVRSYWAADGAELYVWSTRQHVYISHGIWTDRGLLATFNANSGNPTGPDGILRDGRPAIRLIASSRPVYPPDSPAYKYERALGTWFKFEPIERGDGVVGDWNLEIPIWAIAAGLSAPLVPIPFKWWRRRTRHRQGLCPACGYNLLASPGRCPECGANQNNRDGHVYRAEP
jgi:hypothetical protein